MKIFFDTEFTGLHKNTTLISIGCVAEDGSTFYAEFIDYDKSQCNEWIKENVISNLKYRGIKCSSNDGNHNWEISETRDEVRIALEKWLSKYSQVQFVSDVCHYDMVLLIDLFGTAFDLPKGVNASCHDINQDIASYYCCSEATAFDKSREDILAKQHVFIDGDKHNALYDAMVIKAIYQIVSD